MNTLYGIPNCNTVKKARDQLAALNIAYTFHDYKKQGVPEARLRAWMEAHGWEALLNRKGTTWRTLSVSEQSAVLDLPSALALMQAKPSVIKRPVLETETELLIGFDEAQYQQLLVK